MKGKSLGRVQLFTTDPMDCSLPGSSIHGIFQARVLEWGAIAFSNISDCSLCYFPHFSVLSKTELHGTGLAADVSAGTDDFPAFEEGKTSYFLQFVLLQSRLSSTQEAERRRAKLE